MFRIPHPLKPNFKKPTFSKRHGKPISNLVEFGPVADVARILAKPLSFLEKCEQMLGVLARAIDADFVTLREPNVEGTSMELIAAYKRPGIVDIDFPQSIAVREIPVGPDASPTAIDDTSKVSQPIPAYLDGIQRSAVIAPILQDGVVIGRLGFGSTVVNRFDDDAKRMISSISGTFGVLIQNARLLEHREVEANIGRILGSSLEISEALDSFTKQARGILGFDRLILNSIDESDQTFITEFTFGEEVQAHQVAIRRSYAGTLVEAVAQSRQSQILPRLDSDQDLDQQLAAFPRLSISTDAGYRYFISVPLNSADHLVGTLTIMRKDSRFTEDELTTTERLGNLVAGALASFKLEEYKRQAEKEALQSRAILEVEANIGRILSTPQGLRHAVESLESELGKILTLDHVVLTAVDLESETFTQEFEPFLNSDSLFEGIERPRAGMAYAGSITSEVIRSGNGLILNRVDPRVVSGQFHRARAIFEKGYKSMMAAPLVFENKTMGAIVFTRKSGVYGAEDIPVAERIAKLLAGALETFRITSERNQALLALSESEGRFRQIADSIGGVFWLANTDPHQLVYASPNFQDLWGMPQENTSEGYFNWLEVVHPDDLDSVREAHIESTKSGTIDIEYRTVNQNGEIKWLRSSGFPVLDEVGNLHRVCGITEDITEKKLELERIVDAGRLLSIGELASGVAHEINNPLACINLYSEMLMKLDLPVSVMEDLQIITYQGKRAAGIVRNLLQFARNSSPNSVDIPAREFIERCINLKQHDFRINNITVTTNVPADLNTITVDEPLMTQVLVNILSNAEQACTKAHGRGHVSVVLSSSDDSICISISDDGIGIPTEDISKIFAPFFTTKEVGDGTGLGLSVSYGIVAQMGGRIWAESDGATGSTFHVEIPKSAALAQEKPDDANQEIQDDRVSPIKVLVVDDEQNLRNIMARLLERNQCSVDLASDGEEAWSKVGENEYSCILLDLRMPGVDGQELFERMQQTRPDLVDKVIFVTGDLANSKSRSFLNDAANHVLEKPINTAELIQTVISVAQTN